MQRHLLSLVCPVFLVSSFAAEETPARPQPVIRELGGGLFQVGEVTFDKAKKTVVFPAAINMKNGVLEYLLVTEQGKAHESLLTTKIDPFDVHVAMLLLGAKPPAKSPPLPPSSQISADYLEKAEKLEGRPVEITATWKEGEKVRTARGEDLLLKKDKPVRPGPWIYNGSILTKSGFLAQEEGSLIALVTDPTALINNPRPGHTDDLIWSARTAQIPAVGTPVALTLKLLPTTKK